MNREPLSCFEVWKKDRRCTNCISARVCPQHERIEKFEFVDGDIFHVISKYIVVEDEPLALEMVSASTDETLFEAYGKDGFINTIEEMNRKLYVDELTDAYNRRYYDEQVNTWGQVTALAVVDVDNFKGVNDTYGHSIGDEALKAVANVLMGQIRSRDAVIRFGGDEFLMVFVGITQEAFYRRLEEARAGVERIRLEGQPDLRLTTSIGGAYSKASLKELFETADKRLYHAKREKNVVVVA